MNWKIRAKNREPFLVSHKTTVSKVYVRGVRAVLPQVCGVRTFVTALACYRVCRSANEVSCSDAAASSAGKSFSSVVYITLSFNTSCRFSSPDSQTSPVPTYHFHPHHQAANRPQSLRTSRSGIGFSIPRHHPGHLSIITQSLNMPATKMQLRRRGSTGPKFGMHLPISQLLWQKIMDTRRARL